jgi:hypothetical protein
MYLGDEGLVHTRAYADGEGGLAFVHEVYSAPGTGGPAGACAVAIEEFRTGGLA